MGSLGKINPSVLQLAYSGKKVLITGDTGFKGSWLSIWLNMLGANVFGYSLEPKTDRDNYVKCNLDKKITHFTGDVRNLEKLRKYILSIQPEFVFHLAAQPLVLESYRNPQETFETNIMGTVNVLDIIRQVPSVQCAIIITTDKVYENNEWYWGYRENDRLGGKDPYSASKAAAEIVVSAYRHSFFKENDKCKIVTTRAGNVIGGGDWAENRIVPDFFRAIEKNEKIILRNPWHSRPWEHVLEPLGGYLLLGARLLLEGNKFEGSWNFGPSSESDYSVKELIERIIKNYGKGEFEFDANQQKPHESGALRLDISKAVNILKWKPVLNFEETIEFTVQGYKDELIENDLFERRVMQIINYMQAAESKNITWMFE